MTQDTAAHEPVEGEVIPEGDETARELVERVDHEAGLPVPSRNYQAAVELGHVLAQSGYFKDARDPAKAAVKVMIGMDLGLSPTTALRGIHMFEGDGKMQVVVEGRLLAGLIKAHPRYRFEIIDRTDKECTLRFFDGDESLSPDITWTIADAERANLTKKHNWKSYPRDMLYWRAVAEGCRVHCPDVTNGMPVYTEDEMPQGSMREALDGPAKAQPLTDAQAEESRAKARAAFDQLRELNPDLLPPGQFAKLTRDAGHSHEELDNLVATIEDLRDTEAEIQQVLDAIAESSEQTAKEARGQLGRIMGQRERLAHVRGVLETIEEGGPDGE